MSLDAQQFEILVAKGKWKKLFPLLKDMSSKERRELAPTALRLCKKYERTLWDYTKKEKEREKARAPRTVSEMAVLACGTLTDWKQLNDWWRPDEFPFQDILQLELKGLDEWADFLLERTPRCRLFTQMLHQKGLIDQPTHDHYYLGLVNEPFKSSSYEFVKEHPEVIEDLWKLLEIEGQGEWSLASADKYLGRGGSWTEAFIQLSEEGLMDRQRLLDVTLDVLGRDFAQFRASWYSRFQIAIKPTVEEIENRLEGYIHLLNSSIPPTVSFGLKMIETVEKKKDLPYQKILLAAQNPLQAKAKGTVLRTLKLLSRGLKKEQLNASEVLLATQQALIHPHTDVHDFVLELHETYRSQASEEVWTELEQWADYIPASRRSAFSAFITTSEPALETEPLPLLSRPTSIREETKFAEITTLSEWVRTAAYVLANHDDVGEIERLFAAAPLLASIPRNDFLEETKVLRPSINRSIKGVDVFTAFGGNTLITLYLAVLLELRPPSVISVPKKEDVPYLAPTTPDFHIRRIGFLAERAFQRCTLPVISSPTHIPFWIDPKVLHQRLEVWAKAHVTPNADELAIAKGRLTPTGEELTFKPFFDQEEFNRENRYLNRKGPIINIDPPLGNDPIVQDTALEWVLENLSTHRWSSDGVRQDLSLCPRYKEPILARGAEHILLSIQGAEVEDSKTGIAYLEVLLEASQEITWAGSFMLTTGISSEDSAIRTFATDLLIDKLQYEDVSFLKHVQSIMVELFSADVMTPKRTATHLSEISLASSRHGALVRDTLIGVLAQGVGNPSRFSPILELLVELLSMDLPSPVFPETFCSGLDQITSGGKTKQAVKKLREFADR